ncbi:MAG: hypothetical protein J6V62_04110 [Paludibacteraceae bacterium]|nr:hypothetical protein [Paludibacteraceae bacterium]
MALLDKNVKDQVSSTHKLFFHQNFYYWNDAMRGILIGEVCPRMIEAGKPTLALQLANMADNMLLGKVNKIATGLVAKEGVWYGEDFSENTLHNYRYAENLYNPHDYSNSFFEMIDSLDAKTAAAYLQHVVKPASALEQYANERGYTGRDYLNDMVGTHYLRELNYSQALAYLSRVSDAYRHHHNLTLKFDPFSYLPKPIAPTAVFKLGFAQEMLRLEGAIKQAVDGDEKARLLYKYALGTLNSFKNCWPLVHYYKGTGYVNSVCRKRHWWDDAYTQRAYAQFDKLVAQACAVAEDKNIAADIQYELCNFKTVAQQYPASEKAQLIKGECDNLKDYYRSFQPVGYYY